MHLIGCLIMGFLIGIFLLIGVAQLAIRSFLGIFFPSLRHKPFDHNSTYARHGQTQSEEPTGQATSHSKIFEKNEDEYVDFEEMKE